MDFEVFTSDGKQATYNNGDRYRIENGVLYTTREDEEDEIIYGPTAWLRVEHAARRPAAPVRIR